MTRTLADISTADPQHAIVFRVRYDEADQMGVVHHSRYLTYFEMGRVELMRHLDLPHLVQEERGQPLSIRCIDVRYLAPARYDDLLELTTAVTEARGARIIFVGRLRREGDTGALIAEARMEAAAITPAGRPRRLSPEERDAFAPGQ
jgi:acyl-CoA thioester hydrolase